MKKILFVGFGIFSLCGIAIANETTNVNDNQGFSALDTDNDGTLSLSETSGHSIIEKNFVSLDTDKDGSLSQSEFDALHALTQVN